MSKISRSIIILFLLLITVYSILFIRFYAGTPSITHDYTNEINTKARSVKPENRAWPLYREAILTLKHALIKAQEINPALNESLYDPEEEIWPQMLTFLNSQQPAIEKLRSAASKPGLGYIATAYISPEDKPLMPGDTDDPAKQDPNYIPSLIEIKLPYLSELRFAAKILAADTTRAALANDSQTTTQNLLCLINMSNHSREIPTIIGDLVSMALLTLTEDRITYILQNQPDLLTEQQLQKLAHALTAIWDNKNKINLSYNEERLMFYDTVQRVYTDDGNGNGRLTKEGVRYIKGFTDYNSINNNTQDNPNQDLLNSTWGCLLDLVIADRKSMTTEYDRLMNIMLKYDKTPLWQRTENTFEIELESLFKPFPWNMRYELIRILLPALSRVSVNAEIAALRRDATLTILALEQYHKKHHNYPQTLNQLIPDYLTTIPIDRFDGNPLRYKLTKDNNNFVLYCIGIDMDDDHGNPPDPPIKTRTRYKIEDWRPPTELTTIPPNTLPDGDWILWNSNN